MFTTILVWVTLELYLLRQESSDLVGLSLHRHKVWLSISGGRADQKPKNAMLTIQRETMSE